MQRADPSPEAAPPEKRRRWLRWTIAGATAAIAGLFLLYLWVTAPVMSREEMQPYFDAARKYLTSASPERLALGERYLDVLAQMRDAAGDVDEEILYTEEGAATREELIASTRESLEKLRALAAEGPGALEYRELGEEVYDFAFVRSCVQALRSDVMQGVAARDFLRVREDVRAAFAVAETFDYRGRRIARLCASVVRCAVCRPVVEFRAALPEDVLRDVADTITRAENGMPPLEEYAWGEIDLVKTLLASNAPEKAPALINRMAVKRIALLIQWNLEFMAVAAKPPREAIPELEEWQRRLRRLMRDSDRLIKWPWMQQVPMFSPMFCTWLAIAYDRFMWDLANLRGTRIAVALELHARAKGEYPEKLALLVPERIEALPRDPFSGEDFRYARRGDSYLLYSVDRNLEDDGGVVNRLGPGDGENRAPRILATGLDLVIFGAPAEEE